MLMVTRHAEKQEGICDEERDAFDICRRTCGACEFQPEDEGTSLGRYSFGGKYIRRKWPGK